MEQGLLITLAIALLSALCVGGAGFALFGTGKSQSDKRVARVAAQGARAKTSPKRANRDEAQRRKQLQDQLKELEEQRKENAKLTVKLRIERAGLSMEVRTFYILSAVTGAAVML